MNFTNFSLRQMVEVATMVISAQFVQTKFNMGTSHLDNHHQSFQLLISRSVQCVLAQLSPVVD